jgi:hypothetical protein
LAIESTFLHETLVFPAIREVDGTFTVGEIILPIPFEYFNSAISDISFPFLHKWILLEFSFVLYRYMRIYNLFAVTTRVYHLIAKELLVGNEYL